MKKIGSGLSVIPSRISVTAAKIVPMYPTPTPIPDSRPRFSGRLTMVRVAS